MNISKRKPDRRAADFEADYIGVRIPDEFIVGYGLDYAEKFRHLPYVAVVEPSGAIENDK